MTLSIIHHEHDCVVSDDPYSHYKWAMQFVFVWFADMEVQCMCGLCEHVTNYIYIYMCVHIYICIYISSSNALVVLADLFAIITALCVMRFGTSGLITIR